MEPNQIQLLHQILSQPTAPFREGNVIQLLLKILQEAKVPHFLDPLSNLIIGAASQSEYKSRVNKKTPEPLRVFIAHMDHPGFHGVSWKSKTELLVQWHGGSPTEHLNQARVWIQDSTGRCGTGTLANALLHPSKKALNTATVLFDPASPPRNPDPMSYFGGFKFRAPYWKEENLLYTQVADDLIGCFAIVSTAIDLWKQKGQLPAKKRSRFLGILTRAEEVGFIGAIGHFELQWLKRNAFHVCISLETSRTLPGAEIGKGPIVRLGDRLNVFDPGLTRILTEVAQSTLPDQHQRRIMDGGACEASAALVYGHPSIGISVPLGNYHNQSLEGGPDAAPPHGPAPEFVHLGDIHGLLQLCHALLQPKLPWHTPWKTKALEFKKNFKNYQSLLRSGP